MSISYGVWKPLLTLLEIALDAQSRAQLYMFSCNPQPPVLMVYVYFYVLGCVWLCCELWKKLLWADSCEEAESHLIRVVVKL
jgi:hypothetical protein